MLPILPPFRESDVQKTRRDVMLNLSTYADTMDGVRQSFEIVTAEAISAQMTKMNGSEDVISAISDSTCQRSWDYLTGLHIQYSAGASLASLRAFFPILLASWEEYAKYHVMFHGTSQANGRKVPHLDLYDKDYWRAIRLTSFAICLGHTNLLPRVAALWDYENDDMDGLLERLVAPYAPGRGVPPDECTRHLPYFKTLKIFEAEPEQRSALMAKYLDEWYKASRREPYYDSHTKGRLHSYYGYWSFEAAAIAVELDIDDSSFRDKPFYPAELADFGRSFKTGTGIGAEDADRLSLRCEAGQPCPKAGYWMTPAKAGSRRYFQLGDVMPAVASDYGSTIWQWDNDQSDPKL
ncbi:PoNe immunity protein domain-containing protein [Ralstonia pseudosolanacearum]|uniref:PoNe immunity protein domain-containing protein n=1 Tax=Ralstonia pseudosolanacearum TaxID=1310165 RepID=UPI003AAA6A7E